MHTSDQATEQIAAAACRIQEDRIETDIRRNMEKVRACLGGSMDVVIRDFRLGNGQEAAVFYIDNLVNKEILGRDFFAPLQGISVPGPVTPGQICKDVLKTGELRQIDSFRDLTDMVLLGWTGLFLAGADTAVAVEAVSWPQRGIVEPGTDVVIRGPREGFIENVRANAALLRRKIHHKDLRLEELRLGKYSNTPVVLAYVDSIANKQVLAEVKKRLQKIDIDAILDSGYVEQFIQETGYSLFPTVGITEKPDIAAAKIMEGRTAILVDGSPVALTVPMFFAEGLQSAEDYYNKFYYASWLRIIRMLAFLTNIWLPGLFVAIVSWHPQIIPARLFMSMAAAEKNTPFSSGLSMLLMLLAYEVLKEAGVRLPKPAGQAISIVGAIIMGDAAISAGLISAPVLIALSLTVTASFVTVNLSEVSTVLRLFFLAAGWAMGVYGLLLVNLLLLFYLSALSSFGLAYFAPFSPLNWQGLKDVALRLPLRHLQFRPPGLSRNRRRMRVGKKEEN
ncbi:MAG: spore germination protein [Firmicutes bacterium]|nr:spore germination protein [Bacillota bacterium]